MKVTKQEVVNALTLIHDICASSQCADDCPFSDDNDKCLIKSEWYPEEWCIVEVKDKPWKAFE